MNTPAYLPSRRPVTAQPSSRGSFEQPNGPEEGARYAAGQREEVERALKAYAPDILAVFDVDFGHTGPQLVIPYGGTVRVDGPARRVTVTY